MNIFATNINPQEAAQDLCDKHVVKMPLETAQLLSTAVQALYPKANDLYKPTHVNHPCTRWVLESVKNFKWLYFYGVAICEEYSYRYGKMHKSFFIIQRASHYIGVFPKTDNTKFVLAMPDKYKCDDPIIAYKNYIIHEKVKKFKFYYTKRNPPSWLISNTGLIRIPITPNKVMVC